MVSATLPFEQVILDRYRIRVSRAEVHFDDGFGLVRLDGEASFADQKDTEGHAEVTVFGGLDVVALDPVSGVLRGSVKIIAVDARRVNVYGVRSFMVEDLVEQLGRERLDAFSALASAIEIPGAARGQRHPARGRTGRGAHRGRDRPRARVRGRREGLRREAVGVGGHLHRHRLPRSGSRIPAPTRRPREPSTMRLGRRGRLVAGIVAAVALAVALATSRRLRSPAERFEAQRAEHERRRAEFAVLAAADPVVKEALAQGGDVILGIRPALVEDVLREVAVRYLDRVALDLPLEKQVHDTHEVQVGTFLGKMNAGTWTMDMTIHRVTGTLRARRPHVAPARGNALRLADARRAREGAGLGHRALRLGRPEGRRAGVPGLRAHTPDRGRGHPERLSRGPGRVPPGRGAGGPPRGSPYLPPSRSFRIKVDLITHLSWDDVRRALEEQDRLLRGAAWPSIPTR